MLDLPFAAALDGEEIVAVAGTIIVHGTCGLIGNFVTRADRRGHGWARRLARHLAWELQQLGIAHVWLVTTADNTSACRAYEAAGYQVEERWRQLDLAAA